MDPIFLARLQFAATTAYHFLFVPVTLGLTVYIAIIETAYVRTGDERYKKMAKFWGKLFLINFAMGVATGILQEFQFGMNWSEYSRFMGDIFGAPLAIEALLAFYLESIFIGIWIFGWDRISKGLHAFVAWMVALGSNLSAFWILAANSFMQEPVGFEIRNGRAEMTDFFAIILNPHLWVQFPHVLTSAMATAGFLILGISAWHLKRKKGDDTEENREIFRKSFNHGVAYALIGTVLVVLVGHTQAQHMVKAQPMKMAAAEAHWDTEDPAPISLFTIGDEEKREDVFAIKIPGMLSFLAYNSFDGEVKGINDLQKEYEETYGPGDYVPPVAISYWSFRIMVGAGMVMLLLMVWAAFLILKRRVEESPRFLKILPWAIALPFVANTAGWVFTEIARQPWIVFGLQRTEDAVSKSVTAGEILFSLLLFTALYTVIMIAALKLFSHYAKRGVVEVKEEVDEGGDFLDEEMSDDDTTAAEA